MLASLLYYYNIGVILEWIFLRAGSINLEFIILVDWIRILFISLIFLISSIIILYRIGYIEGEKFIKRFVYLVLLFIFSIVLIIIRPNIVRILFGWDGLGLVSYCLVIYYQNYMSYNSGMVTVLCNRVGDVGILMMIRLMLVRGRWNIWFLRGGKLVVLIILLAAIRKRAQIPFSTWLPMAIAAPTPVSALVHSSTLVTAGVYLIIRFNQFLLGRGIGIYLFYLSVITIFIAGAIANVENDLKKIIALSTLRQLGIIIIILRLGFKGVAFYHLLTHAIFKSMLFICAGIIIHSIINNQDIRVLGNLNEVIPFTIIRFYVSNLALCGMPFVSGFYSKDLIMELIYRVRVNIYVLFMVVISLIFTVSYSFRLFYYLFFNNLKFFRFNNFKERRIINLSILRLIVLRILIGSLLSWIFFYNLNVIPLKLGVKIFTLIICVRGVLLGGMIRALNYIYKFYNLVYFLRSIWFLNYIYIWLYRPVNNLGVYVYYLDKVWVEFIRKNMILYIIQYINFIINYKIYIFRLIFIYLCLMIKLFI